MLAGQAARRGDLQAGRPAAPFAAARTAGEHDPDPALDPARRDDRAYHLERVCARFPRTISTQGAHRLARLLRVSTK